VLGLGPSMEHCGVTQRCLRLTLSLGPPFANVLAVCWGLSCLYNPCGVTQGSPRLTLYVGSTLCQCACRYLLSHSQGNILDDENLIETLAQSKVGCDIHHRGTVSGGMCPLIPYLPTLTLVYPFVILGLGD
jgi:hypothetical protein